MIKFNQKRALGENYVLRARFLKCHQRRHNLLRDVSESVSAISKYIECQMVCGEAH